MKRHTLEPEFVELMPAELAEGTLYVSMAYATTIHLCACGCRNNVVLPLSPADWQLFFDGEAVSLTPSVGNWEFPCRSHYWIRGNRILWAGRWSKRQVELGRQRDGADLDAYLAGKSASERMRRPGRFRRLRKTLAALLRR